MKRTLPLLILFCGALLIWGCEPTTLTDSRDGQVYNIVKIGSQWWMAENLNYKTDNSYCYEDDPANCGIYGRLYGFEAALDACPPGWHLPSDEEWSILIRYLDPDSDPAEWTESQTAGHEMKSQTGWDLDGNGSNSSGFSGLPSGNRSPEGTYRSLGISAYIWSATPYDNDENDVWRRVLQAQSKGVFRVKHGDADTGSRYRYFAVRCIKN